MKGSLIVVGFFVLGVLAGRSDSMPAWVLSSTTSFVALCALLLCVGIGIGLNPDMKNDIKRSEERRVGKSVDLGGRRIIKKKTKKKQQNS